MWRFVNHYHCFYLNIIFFVVSPKYNFPLPFSLERYSLFQHPFSNTHCKKSVVQGRTPHPPPKPSRLTLILQLLLQTVFPRPRFPKPCSSSRPSHRQFQATKNHFIRGDLLVIFPSLLPFSCSCSLCSLSFFLSLFSASAGERLPLFRKPREGRTAVNAQGLRAGNFYFTLVSFFSLCVSHSSRRLSFSSWKRQVPRQAYTGKEKGREKGRKTRKKCAPVKISARGLKKHRR